MSPNIREPLWWFAAQRSQARLFFNHASSTSFSPTFLRLFQYDALSPLCPPNWCAFNFMLPDDVVVYLDPSGTYPAAVVSQKNSLFPRSYFFKSTMKWYFCVYVGDSVHFMDVTLAMLQVLYFPGAETHLHAPTLQFLFFKTSFLFLKTLRIGSGGHRWVIVQ